MGPEFDHLGIVLFFGIFILTIVIAFWKGAGPERAGASVLALAFILQAAAYALVPPLYMDVDLVSVAVDLFCFSGLGIIAIYARRIWPIWASSFQLLSLAAHFSRQIQVEIEPLVYSIMKTAPTGAALVLILTGTIAHRARIRKRGSDRSWMNWPHLEKVQSIIAIRKQSASL